MGAWTHFHHQYFNPDSSLSLYFKLYPRTKYQVIIVIFEKNHRKKLLKSNFHRTVLLHVERSIFVFGFVCLCSYFLINTIRIYSGPLPSTICWWNKFFINFGSIGLLFSFCASTSVRVSILESLQGNKLVKLCPRTD